MNEIVAIDLGSNSFRVLVYDCLNHQVLGEHNEVVGMADGLNKTKCISFEAQERVINAIKNSSEKLKYDPSKAVCVTTAAMRLAENSSQVLSYFKEQTGAKFNIIDGKEEARLTLLAVKYALKREKINDSKFILLDIGGGSTEIIVSDGDDFICESFNFGIVTLTQKHNNYEELNLELQGYKTKMEYFLTENGVKTEEFTFVATAGTPTTIAAIKLGQDFFHYDKDEVNGTKISIKDLDECLELFRNSSTSTITKLVGKGRVEFIEVGTFIYKSVFEVLNKKESIVLDDGLREGVAINSCLLR